jgi:hypothetical protein
MRIRRACSDAIRSAAIFRNPSAAAHDAHEAILPTTSLQVGRRDGRPALSFHRGAERSADSSHSVGSRDGALMMRLLPCVRGGVTRDEPEEDEEQAQKIKIAPTE